MCALNQYDFRTAAFGAFKDCRSFVAANGNGRAIGDVLRQQRCREKFGWTSTYYLRQFGSVKDYTVSYSACCPYLQFYVRG